MTAGKGTLASAVPHVPEQSILIVTVLSTYVFTLGVYTLGGG